MERVARIRPGYAARERNPFLFGRVPAASSPGGSEAQVEQLTTEAGIVLTTEAGIPLTIEPTT